MNNIPYICGVTFAPFAPAGSFSQERARQSLRTMKENTNANFIILAPNGLQETPQSEEICYTSAATMTDDELKSMIEYAQSLGLRVALKPTANCKNGTWRAHINFFDEDVPCEPKWGNWFASYMYFQSHYARISQEMGCEMHIAGCESGDRQLLRSGKISKVLFLIIQINIRNTMCIGGIVWMLFHPAVIIRLMIGKIS